MNRGDLERLSRDELIELVLRLQRPDKTSRNLSKPPSTDRKERRENSKPGGAKPGHEGHFHANGIGMSGGGSHRSRRLLRSAGGSNRRIRGPQRLDARRDEGRGLGT